MYITLETDYSIRIVLYLIQAGIRVDARNISEQTNVTLRFALKILRKLVGEGIAKSYKGIKGGYELAKRPEDISLYEIIHLIEGNCFLNRCLDENIGCNRHATKNCKVRKAFGRVSEIVKDEFSSITMDQLI